MSAGSSAPTAHGAPGDVLRIGDPRLRAIAAPCSPGDPGLRGRLATMRRALAGFRAEHGWGRALAAPQLGVCERAIVVQAGEWDLALLNPTITWRSAEQILVWDDCFSLPSVAVPVLRHASISLAYQDDDGRERRLDQVAGDLAELLQHEVDHLDGVLFVDRAIAPGLIVAREHKASAAAAYAAARQAGRAAEPGTGGGRSAPSC